MTRKTRTRKKKEPRKVCEPLPNAVGVLGGTFDPVHLGHLHVAQAVRQIFALPRVLLVPCARPPHKVDRELTEDEHRLQMLRVAVDDQDGIEVSTVELDRGGVSYTLDTLRHFRDQEGLAPVFIMGMDSLEEIHTWKDYQQLVAEFDLIVVDRPGQDLDHARSRIEPALAERIVSVPSQPEGIRTLEVEPLGTGGRIFHVSIPAMAVSSSLVRSRAARGLPLDGLVPPAVARYIFRQGLYGSAEAALRAEEAEEEAQARAEAEAGTEQAGAEAETVLESEEERP